MLCSYDSLPRYFFVAANFAATILRTLLFGHQALLGLYVSCTKTCAVIVLPLESRIFSGAPVCGSTSSMRILRGSPELEGFEDTYVITYRTRRFSMRSSKTAANSTLDWGSYARPPEALAKFSR